MKVIKRWNKMATVFCLMTLVLSGCGNSAAQETEQEIEIIQEAETDLGEETAQEEETVQNTVESTEESVSGENILIAYFTWADNTYVENPEKVDVDATTSASVLQPGNVGLIASWIQEETGADLFSIQVEDLYSSDYDECLDRASEENAQNARPVLATHVDNMEQYDTIYLGYPKMEYPFSCVLCA